MDTIPVGAVGFISNDNNGPAGNIGASQGYLRFPVISSSYGELILEAQEQHQFTRPSYIGVIASSDGSTIYWVNDTKPLP